MQSIEGFGRLLPLERNRLGLRRHDYQLGESIESEAECYFCRKSLDAITASQEASSE